MGERDLSPSAAVKFVVALGLEERETEYFLALVGYNNASDPHERDVFLQQMKKVPRPIEKTILSVQEFDYFGKWYVAVVGSWFPSTRSGATSRLWEICWSPLSPPTRSATP